MEKKSFIFEVVKVGGHLAWEKPETYEHYLGVIKPMPFIEESWSGRPLRIRVEFEELFQNVGYPQEVWWIHPGFNTPYRFDLRWLHIENIEGQKGGVVTVYLPAGEIVTFYPRRVDKQMLTIARRAKPFIFANSI